MDLGPAKLGGGLRQGVAIFLMKKLTFGHFSGRPYGGVLYLGVWGAGSSGPPARARAFGSMKTVPGGCLVRRRLGEPIHTYFMHGPRVG